MPLTRQDVCYRIYILGLDDRGFESRQGLGNFLFTTASIPVLGFTQSPTKWVSGALSLRVKRPGRETDHSPPSSAQYAFVAWCLVKHRDNFTLILPYLYSLSLFIYLDAEFLQNLSRFKTYNHSNFQQYLQNPPYEFL